MASVVPCPHEKVEFRGIQETVEGMPELHLYNCKRCETTVARWGGSVNRRSTAGIPAPRN